MPSSAKQKLVVATRKSGNTKGTIFVIQRTGYLNLTVNGKHYYYNASATNQPMTQRNIVQRVVNQNTTNQRRTITITRKGG